ncbi:hypothetical protein [Actinomadura sp. 9N215]|uniref:hypothetical protein n=1 Tax=Actinomadura sp. 9N215 TaxID=3375150 RepID=UPI0037AE769A
MALGEAEAAHDLIAVELAEVSWPWNLNDGDELDEAVERLSGDSTDMRAAVDSFAALMRFRERHADDVAAAEESMPELVNAYWMAWKESLVASMPTMLDNTWTNFREWAEAFNPYDIGESWDEPPEKFIRAAGWIWVNGGVEISSITVTGWLIDQFEESPNEVALTDFLEIATDFVPKVGGYVHHLVGIISRAGKRKSIPYLKRLAESEDLVSEVRESADRLYRWQLTTDK